VTGCADTTFRGVPACAIVKPIDKDDYLMPSNFMPAWGKAMRRAFVPLAGLRIPATPRLSMHLGTVRGICRADAAVAPRSAR